MDKQTRAGQIVGATEGGFIDSQLGKLDLETGCIVRRAFPNSENEKNIHLKHLEGEGKRVIPAKAVLPEYNSYEVEVNGCQGVLHVASADNLVQITEPAVSVAKDDLNVVAENKVRCGSPTHSSGAVCMDLKRGYQSVDDESCRSNPVFFEDSKNMVSDEDTTRREDPSSSVDLRSNQFQVTSRMKSFILAAMTLVGWLPRGQEEGQSAVLGPTNAFSMESMEPNIILNMVSDEDSTRQEDPLPAADLRPNQSLLSSRIKSFIHAAMALAGCSPRGQEEERMVVLGAASAFSRESVEPDMILIGVPIKLIAREQPFTSMSKSAIQVAMAVALVGGSFTVMLAVPGGVNDSGTAVLGDTIALNVFFVMDTVALHASLAVGMMVATMSQISSKVDYLICIALWVAAVCFILAFHAAAYVVMFPDLRWIVLISGGIVAIVFALLSIFHLSTMFY